MYLIVKTVIESGGFDLTDMCSRIEALFARGWLTDEEREALVGEARDKADPAAAA